MQGNSDSGNGSRRGLWMIPPTLRGYRLGALPADLVAGAVVGGVLVPQAMAYALLAGLPPITGLYASMVPLVAYALMGTSRCLAVGPVALVSLMVASAVEAHASPTDAALVLALLVGTILLAMGLLRAGFLVNLLGEPVLKGFTGAAAVVIAASQAKHLLGIPIPRTERPYQVFGEIATHLPESRTPTVLVAAAALTMLILFRSRVCRLLVRWGVGPSAASVVARSGPLVVAAAATATIAVLGLADGYGVEVVGAIPGGLPALTVPRPDWAMASGLLPGAFAIALVGFFQSYAVADSLAGKHRERIAPDRELMALGVANVGASLTGGLPVTGGFSRSAVNEDAGATSGVASLTTALFVALTLLFFTPALQYLPRAVLAAIIVVAVFGLVDLRGALRIWRYSRTDGIVLVATFGGVLAFGLEPGILIGVAAAVIALLARNARPHVAVLGRVRGTEHFRNVLRHDVETDATTLIVRIDESLNYLNARGLGSSLHELVADRPEVRDVVLVCSGINAIDTTGLACVGECLVRMRDAGITLSLAEVKGPVQDRLRRSDLLERLGSQRVHLSTHAALVAISDERGARAPPA